MRTSSRNGVVKNETNAKLKLQLAGKIKKDKLCTVAYWASSNCEAPDSSKLEISILYTVEVTVSF